MSDMPNPRPITNVELVTYADDITILSAHEELSEAEKHSQSFLNQITSWITENKLLLNPDKTLKNSNHDILARPGRIQQKTKAKN